MYNIVKVSTKMIVVVGRSLIVAYEHKNLVVKKLCH